MHFELWRTWTKVTLPVVAAVNNLGAYVLFIYFFFVCYKAFFHQVLINFMTLAPESKPGGYRPEDFHSMNIRCS